MQQYAVPVFWAIVGGGAGLFVAGVLALVLFLLVAWVIGAAGRLTKGA